MGKQNVQVKKLTRRVQRANASIVPFARRKRFNRSICETQKYMECVTCCSIDFLLIYSCYYVLR